MTAAKFRSLALSLPETVAAEHMNHPDFRVGGKIFATLSWPDSNHGMVKLTPVQQAAYVQAHPDIFEAIDNGWGRQGATSVVLKAAKVEILLQALKDAWLNTAPRKLASQLEDE
jgi:hypothetical protein